MHAYPGKTIPAPPQIIPLIQKSLMKGDDQHLLQAGKTGEDNAVEEWTLRSQLESGIRWRVGLHNSSHQTRGKIVKGQANCSFSKVLARHAAILYFSWSRFVLGRVGLDLYLGVSVQLRRWSRSRFSVTSNSKWLPLNGLQDSSLPFSFGLPGWRCSKGPHPAQHSWSGSAVGMGVTALLKLVVNATQL